LKRYRKKEGTRQRGVELGIICQIREWKVGEIIWVMCWKKKGTPNLDLNL
jgi:hypothetical protein